MSCQKHSLNCIQIFIKWICSAFDLPYFCFLRQYLCLKTWVLQFWMTACYWKRLGREDSCEEDYQLGLYQARDLTVQGMDWRRQKGAVFSPLCSEWATHGAGRDQRVCSWHKILISELWRKMWSVNAVMCLCNVRDCSGSGKVTYILGWHDWPMSADVWRRASFWSAAAQLCPWAVLVPVQHTGDSLYPDKFLIYLSKMYQAYSEYWYADTGNFSFSWKLNNFKESIHCRFSKLK